MNVDITLYMSIYYGVITQIHNLCSFYFSIFAI